MQRDPLLISGGASSAALSSSSSSLPSSAIDAAAAAGQNLVMTFKLHHLFAFYRLTIHKVRKSTKGAHQLSLLFAFIYTHFLACLHVHAYFV